MRLIGIDIETVDPKLKTLGNSWIFGEGKILCTALYYKDTNKTEVLLGCPFSLIKLLADPSVILVGANISYDIGWICSVLNFDIKNMKCSLFDVITLESHIDPYAKTSLETLAVKYLNEHKESADLEEWITSQPFYKGGDFREYLSFAPQHMLESYVGTDARLPVFILQEQFELLQDMQERFYYDSFSKEERLTGRKNKYGLPEKKKFNMYSVEGSKVTRVFHVKHYKEVSYFDPKSKKKLEQCMHIDSLSPLDKQELLYKGVLYPVMIDFELLRIMLRVKQTGVHIDWKLKEANCKLLTRYRDDLVKEFTDKYGEVNFKSSKQKAELFDRLHIPYQYKITVKQYKEKKITFDNYREIIGYLSSYTAITPKFSKGMLYFFVESTFACRLVNILEGAGCVCIANPTIDSVFISEISDKYECASLIAKIVKLTDILDKILGEGYNRYKGIDGKIHTTFNVTKNEFGGAKTGRLSSVKPNLQQIPSHGKVKIGEETIDLAKLCRSIFIADKGCYWAHFDYPQIEFRLFAHFAVGEGAQVLRDKLNSNLDLDFHSIVAQITGLERSTAKRITFGTLYGMGKEKLRHDFGFSKEEAQEVFDRYFSAVPCVKSTMQTVSDVFIERGFVTTISGRHFYLSSENESYKGINGLNQGSSADMTKRAIVLADDEGIWDILPLYVTVHDEIGFGVSKTKEAITAAERVSNLMATSYLISVPVFVTPEIGVNWYESSQDKAEELFETIKKEVYA